MTTTHTDPTAANLLRGVLLHPADDTARLVYADRLEELAGTVPCPSCVAILQPTRGGCWPCRVCGAPDWEHRGNVSDGQHERAEFVRVQCELDPLLVLRRAYNGTCPTCQAREGEYHRDECRLRNLCARERELLTDADRRAEWSGSKCPVCEGSKRVLYSDAETGASLELGCTDCTGTGFAPVEFRRGFVESVRCRMGDVLRFVPLASDFVSVEHTPMVWALTPWARGVLDAHPVTRWEIVDREPTDSGSRWYWPVDSLPADVFRLCNTGYPDRKGALDALSRAVGRVARRLAGLPES